MNALLQPEEIERLAQEAGMNASQLCMRANVARTTFWRWKKRKLTPSIAVYRRLIDALDQVEVAE
jgi:transcriptional regulator with XRE-family HTH domain